MFNGLILFNTDILHKKNDICLSQLCKQTMDSHVCMICKDVGHQVYKCPELSAPLYGKLGEGAQKNNHGEEEESIRLHGIIAYLSGQPVLNYSCKSKKNN